jgi:hypothetical protein
MTTVWVITEIEFHGEDSDTTDVIGVFDKREEAENAVRIKYPYMTESKMSNHTRFDAYRMGIIYVSSKETNILFNDDE